MDEEEMLKQAARQMGRKGGRRQKEKATPEQLAEWGRKGGKLAGRGRPKQVVEPIEDQPKKPAAKPAKKAGKK